MPISEYELDASDDSVPPQWLQLLLQSIIRCCRKEQHLIDKESYDTWIKKQQEQKERQAEIKKRKAEMAASKGPQMGSNRTLLGGAKEQSNKGEYLSL